MGLGYSRCDEGTQYAPSPMRFLKLLVRIGIAFLFVAGCVPRPAGDADTPATPTLESISLSEKPLVRIEWASRDNQRLGLEFSIANYPLPQGFQTLCPLTRLELKRKGETLLLYRNPEQSSLDEFYALTKHSRWYCEKRTESNGLADYLFSLVYYYGENFPFEWDADIWLHIELGEVIATNSASVITLPNQEVLDIPLDFEASGNNLTWLPAFSLTKNDILVEIERVALNPSFALLDACIEYQDHHFWMPIAAISYQGRLIYSTEFLPTFPPHPADRDSILQSTRRCYSFSIPFNFPLDQATSFRIGIERVQIVNDNPTKQECEAVRQEVEGAHPGLQIRCIEFEMMEKTTQNWFQVLAYPSGMSAQEAYKLVESGFSRDVVGLWYMELPLTRK